MPQITVEYSAALDDAFERRAFALAVHTTAGALIDSDLDSFKTRFHRIDEGVIGDGAASHAMIHVEVAILPGRSEETRRLLGQTVLDLAVRHRKDVAETVQTTVEVRELTAGHYHKHVSP
ncbi:5-carboxymethyl-2-hydroxymuconate Delta-isomerase [Nonomuraea dietziae]|uniref:5-carboxymethyl-2-hydroxymuconate isomerase n=1 Tax=Nonomuraea dietziae TaxID=65515 RepID=A0A7W5YPS5_9ACTN|nr:isomerase [Nonomuraea dietziae]MBB3725469.1 5-carboxymethyl-2-hydroxymuconate isomerase [Nonomuraea dietziae]